MSASLALARVAASLERWVARLTLAFAWLALPLLLGVTLAGILSRHVRGVPGEELYDLGGDAFFALVMLSFGYAYLRDGHVRVDIVRDRMRARWVATIEILGCLAIAMPLSAFLIAYGAESAWRAFVLGERQAATGQPYQWVIKSMVPLGFLGLFLAAACVTIRNWLFLTGTADAPAPRDDE